MDCFASLAMTGEERGPAWFEQSARWAKRTVPIVAKHIRRRMMGTSLTLLCPSYELPQLARDFALRTMQARLALVVSAASAGHGSGLI
jgi:hypothetical protein